MKLFPILIAKLLKAMETKFGLKICQIMKEKSLADRYDAERGGAGLQNGGEWIGFENKQSIAQKAKYIKDKCLGGSMVWTVDFDDFKGKYCGQGAYPLLNTIDQELRNSKCFASSPTTQKTQTTVTKSSSTSKITASSKSSSTTKTTEIITSPTTEASTNSNSN